MSKFLRVTTTEDYDVIINTDTIKFIERNPRNKEGSVWIWTDWASSGYQVVDEPIEDIQERLMAK